MPLQSPTVDLLQGKRMLRIVRVLLMAVGMVMVCGLGRLVVMMLLLLLSLLHFLFAAGPLFVLDRDHSPFHRSLF